MKSFSQFEEDVNQLRIDLKTLEHQNASANRLAARRADEANRRKKQLTTEKEKLYAYRETIKNREPKPQS